jgi:hypothetical protein
MTQEQNITPEQRIEELTKKLEENNNSLEEMRALLSANTMGAKVGLNKFKDMIATSFENFTDKYGFKKETESWNELTHKIGLEIVVKKEEAKDLYADLIKSFTKISEKVNVTLKFFKTKRQEIITGVDDIRETFYLLGNKRSIAKLNKEFKDILNSLGFEANDLYHNTIKHDFVNEDQVKENLDKELVKLQFVKVGGQYNNVFLKDLDDEGKISTFYSALWPNLALKIKKGMSFKTEINKFKKENKYLRLVEDFATKNNMSFDVVVNILQVDKDAFEENHLLYNATGANKIKSNYKNIIDNITKFSILGKNSDAFMIKLITVIEDIKSIINDTDLSNERKEEFYRTINETKIFKDATNYIYTYGKIKENMDIIRPTIVETITTQKIEPTREIKEMPKPKRTPGPTSLSI